MAGCFGKFIDPFVKFIDPLLRNDIARNQFFDIARNEK
jgi:hypothetical protein